MTNYSIFRFLWNQRFMVLVTCLNLLINIPLLFWFFSWKPSRDPSGFEILALMPLGGMILVLMALIPLGTAYAMCGIVSYVLGAEDDSREERTRRLNLVLASGVVLICLVALFFTGTAYLDTLRFQAENQAAMEALEVARVSGP